MTSPWPDDGVILYDGVCVFCSRWIRFVASRDTNRRFRFTAIQSDYGSRPRRRPASTLPIRIPTRLCMTARSCSNPTPR